MTSPCSLGNDMTLSSRLTVDETVPTMQAPSISRLGSSVGLVRDHCTSYPFAPTISSQAKPFSNIYDAADEKGMNGVSYQWIYLLARI